MSTVVNILIVFDLFPLFPPLLCGIHSAKVSSNIKSLPAFRRFFAVVLQHQLLFNQNGRDRIHLFTKQFRGERVLAAHVLLRYLRRRMLRGNAVRLSMVCRSSSTYSAVFTAP